MEADEKKRFVALGNQALVLTNFKNFQGAGDRTRTGDVQLGKLAFYQLNYARDYQKVLVVMVRAKDRWDDGLRNQR